MNWKPMLPTLLTLLILVSSDRVAPAEEAFRAARPGYAFEFPRDHGVHPDFRTEWWYFTGNLEADDGTPFGFMLTFFRSATLPPGSKVAGRSPLVADQVYFAHFAISHVGRGEHRSWERIGRAGFGQAYASTTTLDMQLAEWSAVMHEDESIALSAADGDFGIRLDLQPEKPFVIHGRDGVHPKAGSLEQASHYIAATRMATRGELTWAGETLAVTGLGWMDHEFGSDALAEDDAGWRWFALQLGEDTEIMLYQIRRADGTYRPESLGTVVEPDGTPTPLPGEQFTIEELEDWVSPVTGTRYPTRWRIRIPGRDAVLEVRAAFDAQEMHTTRLTRTPYWEGAIRIGGRWQGAPVEGVGYVELVGYGGRQEGL